VRLQRNQQNNLGNNERHMGENAMEGLNTKRRFIFDRNSGHPGSSEEKANEAMVCLEKHQESRSPVDPGPKGG
jgi:hypothetical protein